MDEYIILLGIACFAAGFIIAFWLKEKMLSQRIKTVKGEASRILEESKRQAETLIKEADLEIKDNSVSHIEDSALLRSVHYWDSIRPIPLTVDELEGYKIKDSIQLRMETDTTFRDSIKRYVSI